MPVSKEDWVVATFCNYGDEKNKKIICRSYSVKAGESAWKKYHKQFSTNNYRCWQENKKGKVINDSNKTKNKDLTNKKDTDWIIATFCDYGDRRNKRIICRSYSEGAASRAWMKYRKSFSKGNYRCWQENKKGKVINDSNLVCS